MLRIVLAFLVLTSLAACEAPKEELLSAATSPDGRHKASLYRARDPAGVLGEDGYVVYVEQTNGSGHDRLEVFSGANAHRAALDWRDPGLLIIEFCDGRGVRSMSRYPDEAGGDARPWVTVQDIRAANLQIGGRIFCPTGAAQAN